MVIKEHLKDAYSVRTLVLHLDWAGLGSQSPLAGRYLERKYHCVSICQIDFEILIGA